MLILCFLLVGVTPILGTSVASVPGRYTYAGVVIGKRYLLFPPATLDTVPLENFKVKVGSLRSDNSNDGKKFDIEGYVAHPFYDPKGGINKGRTGKDNRDNIALVIVSEDLPIGRDNVEQVKLADANFPTEGPAYILKWGYPPVNDLSRTNITIHSKAECEANHRDIDCSRNLWGSASDTCNIDIGAPVYSGNTLIGTIADSGWCKNGNTHLFINSIPYYEKWIRRTIRDEELHVA